MDGLSLLGLVAEQRLGEGGATSARMVKAEDVKVELREEQGGLTVRSDLGEFESSTSNIAVKGEGEEGEENRALLEALRSSNQHFEKSSMAVATHLNIFDFGPFTLKVIENQLCKFSKYTGWHLQRSTGMMKMRLTFRGLRTRGPVVVRALLVRKDETYRHFGVDRVCDHHRKEVAWEAREHVLQAAPGMEGLWQYGDRGPRRSLVFLVGAPHPETGDLEATIGVKSVCNDSCSTCEDVTFKQTESSRDLLLVLTLESLEFGVVLARRSFGVWPKAVVRPKDLNKPERRKPKGGAAKLNKLREAKELARCLERQGGAGARPALAVPRRELPKVPLGNGQMFKIAPKLPLGAGRLAAGRLVLPGSRQTFNILLPVESKGGIPTTMELMDTTIGLAIKNARTLGISNQDFLKRIEAKLSEGDAVKEAGSMMKPIPPNLPPVTVLPPPTPSHPTPIKTPTSQPPPPTSLLPPQSNPNIPFKEG